MIIPRIYWYFFVVLILSTVVAYGLSSYNNQNTSLLAIMMLIPGMVSIVFRKKFKEGFRDVGWQANFSRYWIWALLMPVGILFISSIISYWLGYVTFLGELRPVVLITLVGKVLVFSALSLPFGLGEELGWRGYAQGKLIARHGLFIGLLILGIVWGVWHSPAFYFNIFPKNPILGPFVMTPVDNILAAIPLAWLYIRSKSIWVPSLAHAAGDVMAGISDSFVARESEMKSWAIVLLLQLVLAVFCLVDLKSRASHANKSVTDLN